MRAVLILLAIYLYISPAFAGPIPTTYDREIKAAAEKWLPFIPWTLLKAQYWQESRLNPNAISPVGAAGIAQFMPATWREVSIELGFSAVDRRVVGPAIEAGAYYLRKQRIVWLSLKDWSLHDHAMASYNAGAGNIRRAWIICDRPAAWAVTATCLPRITGRHAAETQTYVVRIWRWYWAMQ